MAAVLCRPFEVRQSPSLAMPATVGSCLEGYVPIYSFLAHHAEEKKTNKLPRVDSMPMVPEVFDATTGYSPLPDDNLYVPDEGFNDLPIDITDRLLGQCTSHIAMAVPSGAVMSKIQEHELRACADAKAIVAGSRALPRRHASDVNLPRSGSVAENVHDALEVPSRSLLEATLMDLWEDRADCGLFRYDVTQCPTRVLPGRHGFIAQLNEGRATKKRPTELTLDRVVQPFDGAKFNFKKAAMSEVLVAFCPLPPPARHRSTASAPFQLRPPVAPLAAAMTAEAVGPAQASSPNLVLINVSPIDYGHVLLVPRVLDNLPQALSGDTVLLALQFAREVGSPHFRVGYNSLGAYATINHLHFQSYYQSAAMPCEVAATMPLPGDLSTPLARIDAEGSSSAVLSRKRRWEDEDEVDGGAVRVSRLVGYPVNAFVVEGIDGAADCLESVAAVVARAAGKMQAANQPFNLLVSDAGRKVFVFPQIFAERAAAGQIPAQLADTGVNPAAFEIAGHLVWKRAQDFAEGTEELASRLLAQASLPEDRFMALARTCFAVDEC